METRIAELRYKEVISVEDGSRFGYVGDMEVDMDTGQVRALVVPGRRRFFGLLGREEDKYIPGAPFGALERILFWWKTTEAGERPGVVERSSASHGTNASYPQKRPPTRAAFLPVLLQLHSGIRGKKP